MNKIIRKLRPTDYWRIGEHESWFTDMASQGFHLKKMGLMFAHFLQDEPKQMRYRIEVSSIKNITLEQKEMYSQSGWEYVTTYGDFNVFSSPVELNAPELHTDPAEQSYTLEELGKKFTLSASVTIVVTILIIGMIYAIWLLDSTSILAFVEGVLIQQAILIIVELYVVYTSLRAAISIRTLRKTLAEGKSIDHDVPWRKHRRRAFLIGGIFNAVAILCIILPLIQISMSNTATLSESHINLPIVRLGDIEQNSALERKPSHYYSKNNVDWSNRYSYDWSLLAPLQYKSDEHGIIPNEMWKDGSGVYSPSMSTWVYKLRFPSMGKALIYDLIKKRGMTYEGGDFTEIEHSDFELLIIHEGDDFKEVFASKGKGVIYVKYFGYANKDSIVKGISKKIDLISK